jgi:hypothetical protein
MSGKHRLSTLRSRPKTEELRSAGGREKALAIAGLLIAVALALTALLWGQRSGALSGAGAEGLRLRVPTLGFRAGLVVSLISVLVLFFGWPLYRVTVVGVGLVLGGGVAAALGWVTAGQTGALVGGVIGGLVGALAAWPAEILVRTLSGGLLGMALGMAAGSWTGSPLAMILCALGGLLLGGGLTFLFYQTLIMTYSAMFGALGTVYGAVSVWRPSYYEVEPHPALLGATAALAVLGLFVQRSIERSQEKETLQ